MKKFGIFIVSLMLFGVVAGLLVFASCAGDEGPAGAAGPAGADGADGAQGPAGPGLEPMTRTFDIKLIEHIVALPHEEEEGEHEEEGELEEVSFGHFHRWEPQGLIAFKGDTILLTVTNPDEHAHSFMLPAFGVVTPLLEPEGGTTVVEFTVDEAGIFQFACGLPYDHEAEYCAIDHEHMIGYLTVLER